MYFSHWQVPSQKFSWKWKYLTNKLYVYGIRVWHAWHQYDGLLCSYIILSYSMPCCIVSLLCCFRSEVKILSFRSADNDDYAVKWFNWMKSDIGQMSILRLSYSWGAFGNRRQYRNHDEDDEGRHGKGKSIFFRNGLNWNESGLLEPNLLEVKVFYRKMRLW